MQFIQETREMPRLCPMEQAAGTASAELPTAESSAQIAGKQSRNRHRAGFVTAEHPIQADFVPTVGVQDRFRETGPVPAE